MTEEWFEDDFDDDLTVAFQPARKPLHEPSEPVPASGSAIPVEAQLDQPSDDFNNDETVGARSQPAMRPRPTMPPRPVTSPPAGHAPPTASSESLRSHAPSLDFEWKPPTRVTASTLTAQPESRRSIVFIVAVAVSIVVGLALLILLTRGSDDATSTMSQRNSVSTFESADES